MAKKRRSTLAQMLPRKHGWKPVVTAEGDKYRLFSNKVGTIDLWPATEDEPLPYLGIMFCGLSNRTKQTDAQAWQLAVAEAFLAYWELRTDGD